MSRASNNPPGEVPRIESTQLEPHRDLARVVERHRVSPWRRPIAAHTLEAFRSIEGFLAGPGELLLDSCCGTGESTRVLAARFPGARVLGVDKSAARLARHSAAGMDNYRLLRADVNDLWRLLVAEHVPVSQHWLLYPNPYPKASQVRKRWHASPAFGTLVELGGQLEVRSNWRVYVEEFAVALGVAGKTATVTTLPDSITPMTAFERKYVSSGQAVYGLTALL